MASEERKDNKKPFKGVRFKTIRSLIVQAKVEWPADMPDDMLEDAIAISKKTLDEHDFETDGVEVRNYSNCLLISSCENRQRYHNINSQIAKKVKKHMDEKWEPYWHVFLGKSFGCHSVHERNRFVYFTFEPSKISFLIYKAS